MDEISTQHEVFFSNSKSMSEVDSSSIDLIVTSPPYPMIEMWDDLFGTLNPEIAENLKNNHDREAFQLMHKELQATWLECIRVMKEGALICINIGDATRTIDGNFQVYPNHAEIITFFGNSGCYQLPGIIWRKQTNSPNKFMGSGMLPSNAYVTLEHEHVLVFRKGRKKRKFKPKLTQRYESSYFWEERNNWFSDLWNRVKGTFQDIDTSLHGNTRDRTAAFPIEIPYRLINMFSIYGDSILDPFWGTGTTTIAAALLNRNSFGYEINEAFFSIFKESLSDMKRISKTVIEKRLSAHQEFVGIRKANSKDFKYSCDVYNLPVVTKQEEKIKFYPIKDFIVDENRLIVNYQS